MTIVMLSPAVVADEAAYASRRCDEQELIDAHPSLVDASDFALIELISDPEAAAAVGDADEVSAVAAILIERRLAGVCPCRTN